MLEDSVNGVKAALAAGMTAWGVSGGGHMDDHLRANLVEAGAQRSVADWAEGAALLAAR